MIKEFIKAQNLQKYNTEERKNYKIILLEEENMALTGIKDVDLQILLGVNDRELFTICNSKDIYIYRICKDENFWQNRLLKKYGEKALTYKPEKRSWKNHYLQIIVDLDIFSETPEKFLKYILWSPKGIEDTKYVLNDSDIPFLEMDEYSIPLLEAPEWVITNYYFLKIPRFFYEGKVYTLYTPQELFELLRPLANTPDSFISGSGIYSNYFPKKRY